MRSNLERAAEPAKQRIRLPFNKTTASPEKDSLALARGKCPDMGAKSGSALNHWLSPTGGKGQRKEGRRYSVAAYASNSASESQPQAALLQKGWGLEQNGLSQSLTSAQV